MTIEEATTILNQQKQIPQPINPDRVRIVNYIIYYDDEEGHRWALIYKDPTTFLLFRSVTNELDTFYIVR